MINKYALRNRKDILLGVGAYYGSIFIAKNESNQVPKDIMDKCPWDTKGYQGDGLAYSIGYRFESDGKYDYFVLQLNACEMFIFEKFYIMNAGMNDELLELLEEAKAIRLAGGTVDFEDLLLRDFHFLYREIGEDAYEIYNLFLDYDAYDRNIRDCYNPDTIFDDVIKEVRKCGIK